MPLENNPQVPDDLNSDWPLGGDDIGQGDNHIRGIKTVIKNLDITVREDLANADPEDGLGANIVATYREEEDENDDPVPIVSDVQADLDWLRAQKVGKTGDEDINGIKTFLENPLSTGDQTVDTPDALIKMDTFTTERGVVDVIDVDGIKQIYDADPTLGEHIISHADIPANSLIYVNYQRTHTSVETGFQGLLGSVAYVQSLPDTPPPLIPFPTNLTSNGILIGVTAGQMAIKTNDDGEIAVFFNEVPPAGQARLTIWITGYTPLNIQPEYPE